MRFTRCWIFVFLATGLVLLSGCAPNRHSGYASSTNDAARSEAAAEAAFTNSPGQKSEQQTPNTLPLQQETPRYDQHQFPQPQKDLVSGQTVKVRIDSCLVFSEDVSPKDARVKALQVLREEALNRALPQNVRITGLLTDMFVERNAKFDESTAKSVFIVSSAGGNFINEKVLASDYSFDGQKGTINYRISYLAEIEPAAQQYNSALNLKMALSNTLLKDGEDFSLSLTANTDGYIYLFDFFPDNTVALCLPTERNPENRLTKDAPWKSSVSCHVEPGKDFSIETLYAVFSTIPISGWEEFKSNVSSQELVFSGGEESFIMFQKWLGRSDPTQRVEKMAQVHVMK